jgi:hypothetical protein
MYINYSLPLNDFVYAIETEGERVQLFSVQQAESVTTYADPLPISAIVSNVKVEELILEAGYLITDYKNLYSLIPVRPRDKIRHQGIDYEVQWVQKVIIEKEILHYKSQLRRLHVT